jgi:hypothetical protein
MKAASLFSKPLDLFREKPHRLTYLKGKLKGIINISANRKSRQLQG